MTLRNKPTPVIIGFILSIILVAAPGCMQRFRNSLPVNSQNTIPSQKVYLHRVSYAGETLAMIAEWYIGTHSGWKKIYAYNGDLNPLALQLGDVVRIPDSLIKTDIAMPKIFVHDFTEKYAENSNLAGTAPRVKENEREKLEPRVNLPTPLETPALRQAEDSLVEKLLNTNAAAQ